jgi:hypothetical protein
MRVKHLIADITTARCIGCIGHRPPKESRHDEDEPPHRPAGDGGRVRRRCRGGRA